MNPVITARAVFSAAAAGVAVVAGDEFSVAVAVAVAVSATTNNNEAVIDRRLRPLCCHIRGYFKYTFFLSLYTQGHYVQA